MKIYPVLDWDAFVRGRYLGFLWDEHLIGVTGDD